MHQIGGFEPSSLSCFSERLSPQSGYDCLPFKETSFLT